MIHQVRRSAVALSTPRRPTEAAARIGDDSSRISTLVYDNLCEDCQMHSNSGARVEESRLKQPAE